MLALGESLYGQQGQLQQQRVRMSQHKIWEAVETCICVMCWNESCTMSTSVAEFVPRLVVGNLELLDLAQLRDDADFAFSFAALRSPK
jgi:hypothetical protein